MGFRCLVRCSAGSDSEAESRYSPRSLASSADDYDWDAIYEERREDLLWEWHCRHRVLIRGQYFFRAVLRTWRELCSIDAEISDAMYQQRLLRNTFAAWRRESRLHRRARDRALAAFMK